LQKGFLYSDGPKDTRVGENYQSEIPSCNKVTENRRSPKEIWNPDRLKDFTVDQFFGELEKSLAYTNINQDKAFKVLKRNNLSMEKTINAVNVNKSYYRMYLVVDYKKSKLGGCN